MAGLFADTVVPGLLLAAAVAEAARRAAWSVGKLFLVLQRDRRRDHRPLRMPPPALIHVCVKTTVKKMARSSCA